MTKTWYLIVKTFKNLAILGFLAAYLLPVEENIPFGFIAAFVSLTEAIEERSLSILFGFMPNLMVSYLILRAHKTKFWNIFVLLFFSLLIYWGVLSWLNYPEIGNVKFWEANRDELFNNLGIGYWVWNFSVLAFLSLTLIEKWVHPKPKIIEETEDQKASLNVK